LTGRSIAGQLVAVLNNESGDYSPFNTSSALTGNLLPGRKVQLEWRLGTTFAYTFPFTFSNGALWTGFISSIRPDVQVGAVKVAILTAVGALGAINTKDVRVAMQTDQRTDQLIATILDNAGWPSADRELEAARLL
jgi:hypothetical protein